MESQAFGIPVIARETATIYDCIYHNETGYIVRDKQSFAKKIIQVLSDNKLFLTLRSNSKLNNLLFVGKMLSKILKGRLMKVLFIGNTRLGDAILSTPIFKLL